MNSKWIKDMNVRTETIKYIEKNIGTKLLDTGLSGVFVNLTAKARETKAKIKEHHYIKWKATALQKKRQQNKKAPFEWEKIFATATSNKKLISQIQKELRLLNNNDNNKQSD